MPGEFAPILVRMIERSVRVCTNCEGFIFASSWLVLFAEQDKHSVLAVMVDANSVLDVGVLDSSVEELAFWEPIDPDTWNVDSDEVIDPLGMSFMNNIGGPAPTTLVSSRGGQLVWCQFKDGYLTTVQSAEESRLIVLSSDITGEYDYWRQSIVGRRWF